MAESVSQSEAPAHYVYVASSWRNEVQPDVVARLRAAGLGVYDFKKPESGSGFQWSEVGLRTSDAGLVRPEDYLAALQHPTAAAGYDSDHAAMSRADTFVLVLPCGRSAHLELGWAVGQGKRTAILLDGPMVVPELMYRMADLVTPDLDHVVEWAAR